MSYAYFTWAKSIGHYTPDDTITFTGSGLEDPLNIAGSTGPTEGMPNKYFKGVFSYAIPGGRAFHNRFLRGALGGWTLRSIGGWRSGLPVNVTSGSDFTLNGRSAGQRPDAVAGVDPYIHDIGNLDLPQSSSVQGDCRAGAEALRKSGLRCISRPSGIHHGFRPRVF